MPQEPSAAEIHGRDFPAGAAVFEEGDRGGRTCIVASGAAAELTDPADRGERARRLDSEERSRS